MTCATNGVRTRHTSLVQSNNSLAFFLMESLLQARADSMFPTNGATADEDVNVYLAGLLERFLRGHHDPRLQFAGGALLAPPRSNRPRVQAEYYRLNADHKLLYLGLFDRGDGLRRRANLYGMSAAASRQRDFITGKTCYEQAANHLRGRPNTPSGLLRVYETIACYFSEYVHVLGVLATKHIGLGAILDDNSLSSLMPPLESKAQTVAKLLTTPPPKSAFDAFLDLWLEHQADPGPERGERIRRMAHQLGIEAPAL